MFPRNVFENLHAEIANLVLFEKISGKFCLNFLTLVLSASPHKMHFLPIFSILCAKGVRHRLLLSKKFEIMEKLYTSKTFLKMADGCMPSSYLPGSAPGHKLSYRKHQMSLAYFSHLTPLVLFFFTEKQSQKGRACHNAPALPLNTLLPRSLKQGACERISSFKGG